MPVINKAPAFYFRCFMGLHLLLFLPGWPTQIWSQMLIAFFQVKMLVMCTCGDMQRKSCDGKVFKHVD